MGRSGWRLRARWWSMQRGCGGGGHRTSSDYHSGRGNDSGDDIILSKLKNNCTCLPPQHQSYLCLIAPTGAAASQWPVGPAVAINPEVDQRDRAACRASFQREIGFGLSPVPWSRRRGSFYRETFADSPAMRACRSVSRLVLASPRDLTFLTIEIKGPAPCSRKPRSPWR
jgi:hypothetical protein